MNNYYNDITGDPPITPEEILGFTKITNKVLSMFQPGLVIQKGLRFSIGAISTQKPEDQASFSDSTAEPKQEVAYGGSFASFQPVPPDSDEHFAALANMDTIKEEPYRCLSPYSITSSMLFPLSSTGEKSTSGSTVGIQEGWLTNKRHAPRSTSSQSSNQEDMTWKEKRHRLNDHREVHSSVVAASSTQLLLVEVNKKFSEVARDYRNVVARLDATEAHESAIYARLRQLEATQAQASTEHYAALAHQGINVPKRQAPGTYIPILADLIIDTAASAHMLTELGAFHDLKSFNSTIRLADGSSIQVFSQGHRESFCTRHHRAHSFP